MRYVISLLVVWIFSLQIYSQKSILFQPYRNSHLRLPAYPIITNDPYFSIWSPYNQLYSGATTHWTGNEKPIEGYLRVDGTTYRVMGAEDRPILQSVAPMANEKEWIATYTIHKPSNNWQSISFDDSQWKKGKGAFGTDNMQYVRTLWKDEHSDIFIRRMVNLSAEDLKSDLYMVYSHDDAAEFYINGTLVAKGKMDLVEGERLHLDSKLKHLLHQGTNVIAVHCYNNTGGAYVDFGLYKNISMHDYKIKTADQVAVSAMPNSTYYAFNCGNVRLDLVFTAPMLMDDYDLLSCPINYISYQVKSLDGKEHNVQFMLLTSPLLAVNTATEPTMTEWTTINDRHYIRTGTIDQPILAHKGDGICIDWGYMYLPEINGKLSIGTDSNIKRTFTYKGNLPQTLNHVKSNREVDMPSLAYLHDFGYTSQASSFTMIGYDEIEDIEYMYHRYKAYWAHNGRTTLDDMFDRLRREYTNIMSRCRELDKTIYDDAYSVGGDSYAEILSGAYRQVIAAHKLFRDKDGKLLFFSKENNSNGCVNTVDLTYPSAPLFFVYQPDLVKAMITSILDYSKSGRWTKPFAAHDIGTYPIANGQVYGGDMPLEETGNILILCAQLSRMDGNTSFVDPYWDILSSWANYLSENGQDPVNQLCTDDFAGHWAHNCNLSVKAIMGVAGFSEMNRLKGNVQRADSLMQRARNMAAKWEKDALDGDHYRLAFDKTDTWSQKYNMVWDKIWNLSLFLNATVQREMKYYEKKLNKYGLPLDCRKDYTKSDWIMWTATMSNRQSQFKKLIEPVYNYINETDSRDPISDWHDTKTGLRVGFKARSVIGGYWMPVLYFKNK